MQSTVPIIRAEKLKVDFTLGRSLLRKQKQRAINNVSFYLIRGKALALVGESGSGKSTCARALMRLTPISGGSISFLGEDISQAGGKSSRKEYAKKVQMIFQDPFGSLNPIHTVRHNIARPIRVHNRSLSQKEVTRRVHALLERVGLTPVAEMADKHPHEMSGGQKQRVAIARALAVEPQVILADEPTSMLDVSIRLGILNLMEEMKKNEGIAFLYITHDIATAAYFAEQIAVMYVGHMVEWGNTQSITNKPRHPYTRLLISSIPSPARKKSKPTHARAQIPLWTPQSEGCPFVSRCPEAMPACSQTFPDAQQVDANTYVRCHAVTGAQ